MDLRLFIAIDTDHAAKRAMGKLVVRVRGLGGKITWCRPQQMHLTLSFLGQTPAEQVVQISQAMERAAATVDPFEFSLSGLGGFPDISRPKVLWVGVEEPTGALARLHKNLTGELAEMGFRPEDRPFRPHITLARVRRLDRRTDYTHELFNYLDFSAPEQSAEELILVSSELSPDGSVYQTVARAALGGT